MQLPTVAQLNKEASLALIKRVVPQQAAALHEYSNRQWNGLLHDFYKTRWQHSGDHYTNDISLFPVQK
ncbi:hypothetical protein GCM10022209_53770 [Chitinophaga oryziterrae]